jgi:formylglycine-generating enzyme required for sulfatase activity
MNGAGLRVPRGDGRGRRFAWLIAPTVVLVSCAEPVAAAAPRAWVRVDLVENTVEGPAFDRCQLETTLDGGAAVHWRLFYGEARVDPGAEWSALRSSSGCAQAEPGQAAPAWIVRGSPYFLVDVALVQAGVAEREVVVEAVFSTRKLTGFGPDGAPAYLASSGKRTLRIPEENSAVVPILIAAERESEEFRIRELLLRFSAGGVGSLRPVEYGEVSVGADVPRAEIFLDGGLVARTSAEGPVVLDAVRVGEREIVIQDASRRSARAVARVEKGRRTGVPLTVLNDVPAAADGLRPLGKNPQGGEELWRERDGAIVVRIPGGELQMGSPENEGDRAEQPRHAVRVDGFLIDKTEVTWGQYRRYLAASGAPPPKSPVWGMPEALPVSSVTWEEARAFCAWAGGRLPTEAEWERAARGDDTRQYPWGDGFDPWRCNTRDGGPHAPSPAAAYPDCVSPYGVLDLTGSFQEWCSDWFDEGYYAKSAAENPTGPGTGTRRISRGGAWMSPSQSSRVSSRLGIDPVWHGPMQGFRCAQDDRQAVLSGQIGAPLSGAGVVAKAEPLPVSSRVELRVETVANRSSGPVESCAVRQVAAAGSTLSFVSWSALGGAGPSATEAAGRAEKNLPPEGDRCGAGALPGIPPPEPEGPPAPLRIEEVTVSVGWDPGTMDPGPVGAFRLSLTLTSRQRTGFAPDGKPVYGAPVLERRSTRLEPGEEYVAPVPVDAPGREALGVHEVLLRIRVGWAGREGATEYGSLAVAEAAPGSEVLLDGGVAGRAGPDGSLRLANVPVGRREVRVRGTSGTVVARSLRVVKGRTVLVLPGAAAGGSPPAHVLSSTGRNREGFEEYRRERDGAVMVRVPEGEFLMGNLETEGAPQPHAVWVSAFLIDRLPLTVGRYRRFAAATGRPLPPDPYWGVHDGAPVAFVRWDEAKAYCEWAGGRLPTEAEREKATRGTDRRMWPWGSEPPGPERGVFRGAWGQDGNAVVGGRPAGASPYGLLDTGGNMWEYCEDWHAPDYFGVSPKIDPAGPRTGRARVVKGGSWDSRPTVLSASSRNFAYTGYREGDFGFRCAADAPR